jgi:uncharacterized LabA/DUF88 family protein
MSEVPAVQKSPIPEEALSSEPNNFAFIDGQNLRFSAKKAGLSVNYGALVSYLRERHDVRLVYIADCYYKSRKPFYKATEAAGVIFCFRRPFRDLSMEWKANVDVDLTIAVLDRIDRYNQAVLITGDGDFMSLIRYLDNRNKFRMLIGPDPANTSHLLTWECKKRLEFLTRIEGVLTKIGKNQPASHADV